MLVLLQPSVVPLLVLAARFLACLPELLRGPPAAAACPAADRRRLVVRARPRDCCSRSRRRPRSVARPPARGGRARRPVRRRLRRLARCACGSAIGVDPRDDLRAYAWTYLVDFLLAPVGLLAAWAADELPASPAALLPLAALLALFAHERRGRMANAVALQRMTEESRDRLQSIVQHASDLILILDADGRLRTVTGSTAAFGGTPTTRCWTACIPATPPASPASWPRWPTSRRAMSAEAEWRMRRRRRRVPARVRGGHEPDRRPARRRPRADRARRRRPQALRAAAAPPRLPRRADRARQPRAVLRPHRARAQPPRSREVGGAVRGPRRLQAGQRPARARRGRPAAAARGQAAAWPACARRTRSRGSAATSSGSCSRAPIASAALEAAERVLAALETRFDLAERGAAGLGQRRRRGQPRGRARRRGAAARGRPRDVRGQARRQAPARGPRPGARRRPTPTARCACS